MVEPAVSELRRAWSAAVSSVTPSAFRPFSWAFTAPAGTGRAGTAHARSAACIDASRAVASVRAAVTSAAACVELNAGLIVVPAEGGIMVGTVVEMASGMSEVVLSAGTVGGMERVCRDPGFRVSKGVDLKNFSNVKVFE